MLIAATQSDLLCIFHPSLFHDGTTSIKRVAKPKEASESCLVPWNARCRRKLRAKGAATKLTILVFPHPCLRRTSVIHEAPYINRKDAPGRRHICIGASVPRQREKFVHGFLARARSCQEWSAFISKQRMCSNAFWPLFLYTQHFTIALQPPQPRPQQ